jgi:hypothetical protein
MSNPSHAERHGQAGAAAFDPDQLEVAPGRSKESLEGWIPEVATEEDLRLALEKAFDYRGDVTLTCRDGRRIEGYIYDRVTGSTLSSSFVRLLLKETNERARIFYSEIAALTFSGRDTAAGKGWEAWVRKYWEKKALGGVGASLHPESMD